MAGALGDAIGAHYEGKASCTDFAIPTSLRITDDTQLTLATCDSIIELRGVVPESIAKHFVRWFRAGRLRGIGASTLKALTELSAGGHWALVGATGERSAGSGAAMRVAPLAFFLEPTRPTDRQTIRDTCRITHRNDEAYVGALAILISIRHLANGCPLDRTLVPMLVDSIPDSQVRDRFLFIRDSACSIEQHVQQFPNSGFVADCVPLAVLAAIETSDFISTVERLVRCGGDTDTVASMYGQIVGTAFGTKNLPHDLVDQIEDRLMIVEAAHGLSQLANSATAFHGGDGEPLK